MSNPIIKEHNIETGEIVERPMTDEEYAAWSAAADEAEELKSKNAELIAAKEAAIAKLAALGLDLNDLQALGF